MSYREFPILVPTLLLAALVAGSAGAQDATDPAPPAGRYAMQKTENGIARLDTATGEMTLCIEKNGDLVCRMAADERTAYAQDLERIEKRVESLEKAAGSGESRFTPRLPTQEEIDQTMGFMDKMMRSFMGVAKDFSRDVGRAWREEEIPPAAEPDDEMRKT